MTAVVETAVPFTMDPNLLVSVMKSQAGSLTKALVEGVMNSVDAGSKSVNITLDKHGFLIADTGRGFKSEDEIKQWFGRFGTPHTEGDATYGLFRMGRGQLMSFAKTSWKSGRYVMDVDLEGRGLSYDLTVDSETPVNGCEVTGVLYHALEDYQMRDTLAELKKSIAFTPVPVYVNGALYGNSASRLKTWTYETEDAYIRLVQDKDELDVYNQGIFVESRPAWSIGMGGVVVSKVPLQVNFARNEVMSSRCAVWQRINKSLEGQVFNKLASAAKLSNNERRFIALRVTKVLGAPGTDLLNAKVLTDPSGKHLPLKALKDFKTFVYVSERGSLACALANLPETFVVTDELLTRFRVDTVEEWFDALKKHGHYLREDAVLEPADRVKETALVQATSVDMQSLTVKQRAAFDALAVLTDRVGQAMMQMGMSSRKRELLVGKSKGNQHMAWTDGARYISANLRDLKRFESGLDGVSEWLMVLIHEYVHEQDDSESHDHGEVFYQKYHEATISTSIRFGTLVQLGLREYLRALTVLGAPRPHELTRQLNPGRP